MPLKSNTVTVDDFANILGVSSDTFPKDLSTLISESDFRYHPLAPPKRDAVVLEIIKKLDGGYFTKVGADRRNIWEESWSRNLARFVSSHHALGALVPDFIRPSQLVRWNQDYVETRDAMFELNFYRVVRHWLYRTYLAPRNAVYEFGCGSGFNLAALAALYPDKQLYGLDWSNSSIKLVNVIAEKFGFKLKGRRFDFFAPDEELMLDANCGVFTVCALEQVGKQFSKFLEFLLKRSPGICVHLEPLIELYDENHLVDYLALRYHRSRGYLDGFLDQLKELEAEGLIKIFTARRFGFGSLYHEGYALLVWRPISGEL